MIGVIHFLNALRLGSVQARNIVILNFERRFTLSEKIMVRLTEELDDTTLFSVPFCFMIFSQNILFFPKGFLY